MASSQPRSEQPVEPREEQVVYEKEDGSTSHDKDLQTELSSTPREVALDKEHGSISHDHSVEDRPSLHGQESIRSSSPSSTRQPISETKGEGITQDESPRDVGEAESLSRVTSGPPYTIFTRRQKQFIVFMASLAGFFSPLSTSIYLPALNALALDLRVSSELISLTLTAYLIFQGLAPAFMGDLADMAGRRPTYIICFVIYLGANIGLALQRNYAVLFVLRCMQSAGSSSTIALVYGAVADVSTSAERGKYLGYAGLGTMIAPTLGPVLGGILSQFLGWPSIFWFLTIFAGSFFVVLLISFPETGRNVVGNGSIPPPAWNQSLLSWYQARRLRKLSPPELAGIDTCDEKAKGKGSRKLRLPNPLKTLRIVVEKDAGILLLYNGLLYTAFYCVLASIPVLFAEIYDFNDLQIGFCYIPYGVGASLISVLNGRFFDTNFRRIAKQIDMPIDRKKGQDLRDFPIERARLQIVLPLSLFGSALMLSYGWALQRNAPLAVLIVLLFFMGITLTGAFNGMSVLLVDLFPQRPATATAANNLVRCLMGAGGTAVIIQMIDAMGRGWCYTFMALVLVALTPLPLALLRWGPRWREERRLRIEAQEQRHAEKAERRLASAAAAAVEVTEPEVREKGTPG